MAVITAVLVCIPATPAAVRAQSLPQSAPITNIRYAVRFTDRLAAQQLIRVTMTFDVGGSAPVLLSLPAWTPGAYEIGDFAKYVVNFSAVDAAKSDQPLEWSKLDYDTWRIRPGGARSVAVGFDFVARSLDNAGAWIADEFAFFNGTNVFLYPEGRSPEFASTVTVYTEPQWMVATGMASTSAQTLMDTAQTFRAPSYHDLVDMPFFVGRFDMDSAQVGGHWMRLATYPAGSLAGEARAATWDYLKRAVPPEIAVFGEVPWATYTVMQIADEGYSGASGLEHQNSHVDVITPFAIGNPFMPSLYAHEIFHAWNVKRLRPAELWPYRYDRPEPTTLLWVSEGITDYYADMALVRGGVFDSTYFFSQVTEKLQQVNGTTPVALADASLSTWIGPVDGTAMLYYPKGSLVGLLLDVMIRDASDNHRSLDDVMREMYASTYKKGKGFTEDQWWAAVSKAAGGRSFEDFSTRYVRGREPLPIEATLRLGGMSLETDTLRTPRLGISTVQDSVGIRIAELDPQGGASRAGVRVGDYLVAIGDIAVTDPTFADQFRARFNAGTQSTVNVQVARGQQTVTVPVQVTFATEVTLLAAPDGTASPKAARIRSGILSGAVDR